jgi:hypothetical protein
MEVFGHSTVERSDASGSVLTASIDSMRAATGDAGDDLVPRRVPLDPSARTSRLRVAPNGSMALDPAGRGAAAVAPTLSGMPAMLPDQPVRVGDSWEHEVEMPPLPFTPYRTDGVLATTFRLDSLSADGADAWVSVRGTMRRDGPTRDLPAGTRVVTAGTMRGTLRFDRERRWITEASTTVHLQSEVVATADGSPPMHVSIRIGQRMRVR